MKNIKITSKYFEIFFLFILSLTPFLWLRQGELILGHDSGFRLNPIQHLSNLFYSWDPSYNFGLDWSFFKGFLITQAPEVIFTFITNSLFWGQVLTFVFWFFLMGISMYIFLSSFFTEKHYWIMRMFGSTFYMYNFFLLQAWFIVERAKFSVFAALPLGLLILYKTLTKEYPILKGVILFSLISFFLNAGGTPTLYGALLVVYGICIIYLTCINVFEKGIREILFSGKVIFLFLLGFVLINAYSIVPNIYSVLNSYATILASSGGIEGLLSWEAEISKHSSLFNLLRLQGIPDWYLNENHPYANIFLKNPLFITLSFIPAIILIFGLIFQSKNPISRNAKKIIILLFLIFLISPLFVSGTHAPFGFLFSFLIQTIPGFAIFRSSFYKFGASFWFSYIILISFYLNILLIRFVNRKRLYYVFGVLSICFLLLYHFPFFTVNFFLWNKPFTTKVNVPSYVYQMTAEINTLPSSTRILMLPESDPIFHFDSYSWGFLSLDSLPRLFTNKSIVNMANPSSDIVNRLYETVVEGDEASFLRVSGIIGINKILWRGDVLYEDKNTLSDDFLKEKKHIEEFKSVSLEKTFGQWTLYSITNPYYTPAVSALNGIILSNADSVDLLTLLKQNTENGKYALLFTGGANTTKDLSLATDTAIQVKCVLCEIDDLKKMIADVKFPYARLLPDSPFYFLISGKEQRALNEYRNDPEQTIYANLSFANKRLAEIVQLSTQKKNRLTSNALIRKNIYKYKLFIDDSIKKGLSFEEDKNNEILIKILAYLEAQYTYLSNANNIYDLPQEDLENLSLFVQDRISNVRSKIWISNSSLSQINYILRQDSPETYSMAFIGGQSQPTKVFINGKEVNDFKTYFFEKGIHKISLFYSPQENLVRVGEDLRNEEVKLGVGERLKIPIENFGDGKKLNISFNYKILHGRVSFFIIEQGKNYFKRNGRSLVTNNISTIFKESYTPNKKAEYVYLEFSSSGFEPSGSTIQLRNLSVTLSNSPKILLSKKIKSLQPYPSLSFERIDPTKYIINIYDAKSPYVVMLNESFSPGWKIYVDDPNSSEGSIGNFLKIFNISPIPEQKHFALNGYTNSWYIDKTGSYTLIMEYFPQQFFLIGAGISLLTLLIIVFKSVKYI